MGFGPDPDAVADKKAEDERDGTRFSEEVDDLLYRVRPSERQCTAFKNELQSFDPDKHLIDRLKKGEQLLRLPENDKYVNRSLIAYSGLDPMAFRRGTYGNRPEIAPGRGPGSPMEKPIWEDTVKEVFGNSIAAIVRNHVEIGDLNLKKAMINRGLSPDAPVVLLNFDAHSDIQVNRDVKDKQENIASWVNVMLQKNPNITDFYWVMPDDFKDNPEYSHYYYSGRNKDGILADSTPDRTLYINNKTGAFVWDDKPKDYNENDYRIVGIHKRALQDMPNLADRNVISSLDVDALANDGYDTALRASTQWKGDEGIQKFLEKYKEIGIKPFLSVVSMSPEYVQPEAIKRLEQLAWSMVHNSSNGKDLLATPFRNYVFPHYASHNHQHNGILTLRDEHPVYELLSKLHNIDQGSAGPDGAISLKRSPDNQELAKAVEATAELYKTTPDKAYELLRKYAQKWKFNGKQSADILNFGWVEELLRHSCQQGGPKPGKGKI